MRPRYKWTERRDRLTRHLGKGVKEWAARQARLTTQRTQHKNATLKTARKSQIHIQTPKTTTYVNLTGTPNRRSLRAKSTLSSRSGSHVPAVWRTQCGGAARREAGFILWIGPQRCTRFSPCRVIRQHVHHVRNANSAYPKRGLGENLETNPAKGKRREYGVSGIGGETQN